MDQTPLFVFVCHSCIICVNNIIPVNENVRLFVFCIFFIPLLLVPDIYSSKQF